MCTIQKIQVCNDIEGSVCVAIFYSSTTKWLSSHNFTDIAGRTLPSSVLLPHLFEALYSGRWSWPAFYAWEHCLPSSASLPPDFPSHLQHRHTHMHIYAHVCTHSGIHLTYSLMHSNHTWHMHTHGDPCNTDAVCAAEPPVYPGLLEPRSNPSLTAIGESPHTGYSNSNTQPPAVTSVV